MEGVFVELIAVVAAPEKPLAFAVLKVPLIVAVPDDPNPITEVPAFKVDPDATVSVFVAPKVTAKLFVFNKLPELTFPTAIFPVTLVAVTIALIVAPLACVLFIVKSL